MTDQQNLFYQFPERTSITSTVLAARPHPEGLAIAIAENIVRAAGGGEPRDLGAVAGKPIRGVEKAQGKTWIIVEGDDRDHPVGAPIEVALDAAHRAARRRLHTGVHLTIRSACDHFGAFRVDEAEIAPDASSALIVGAADRALTHADLHEVDRAVRSEVSKARRVTAAKAKSIEHAEQEYGDLFRVSDRHAFRGKVRLVAIEGFDVNPCSGLHHPDTDIGPYALDAEMAAAQQGVFKARLTLRRSWSCWRS